MTINGKTTKAVTQKLLRALAIASNEKDVEHAWREAFRALFKADLSSPHGTDGILYHEQFTMLFEFKYDLNFATDTRSRAIVLLQAIFYLKMIAAAGEKLPAAVFIGDKDECFLVPVGDIVHYLDRSDVDWNTAPSAAATRNPALVRDLDTNEQVVPFVYRVDEHFDLEQVLTRARRITANVPYRVSITPDNVWRVFYQFESCVVDDKSLKRVEKASDSENKKRASDLVRLFYACITDPANVYQHPKQTDTLVVRDEKVKVRPGAYHEFFAEYKQQHSVREIHALASVKDRILDEEVKKYTGAFFTPEVWVGEAHSMLDNYLGPNWRQEFVVWDCAAGTANLTRSYEFGELYLSTLDQDDVQTIEDCQYNQGCTVFQYDFLNDDPAAELGHKVPPGLREAFETRKPVVFLINPPYATAGIHGGNHKGGVADTVVGVELRAARGGACSQELFAQFLYKIFCLQQKYGNRVVLCLYSPATLLTGESFSKFRKLWLPVFGFVDCSLFSSAHFGVTGKWTVTLSLWDTAAATEYLQREFPTRVRDVDPDEGVVVTLGEKSVYSADGVQCSKWIREKTKKMVTYPAPGLTTGIRVKPAVNIRGKLVLNSLGYMHSDSNSVSKNDQLVGLYSSCFSGANGTSVLPESFWRVVALFCARKTISSTHANWINHNDEYLVPNTEHEDYQQWIQDALVYALFNRSSQQSSLRDIHWNDEVWNIPNNWFFMSSTDMLDLADGHGFHAMFQDAQRKPRHPMFYADPEGEAYVYNMLQGLELSPDAQEVLDYARGMVQQSILDRKELCEEPKWVNHHLRAWDAGWTQLKGLLKEYHTQDFNRFGVLYRRLEDRLREGVYDFGFLRRFHPYE